MRVKVSGFLTYRDFSEKIGRHSAAAYPSQRIYLVLRKVVSTGFGVPTFDAVGTPIGTKYIFLGGHFMGAYKDKGGRWYVSVRYKNWLGDRPVKPREDLLQSEMHWHENGSFSKNLQAAWI